MSRAFVVACGILAGLAMGELALRLNTVWICVSQKGEAPASLIVPREPEQSWIEYDPLTGWKNKPGASVARCYPSGGGVHIDSEGFRGGRDYARTAPKGVRRILLIGDSVGFGHSVDDNQTLAYLLEHRLKGVEVPNMAVVAYGLDQILLLYEKYGRLYHPDFILLVPGAHFGRLNLYTWPFGYGRPKFMLQAGQLVLTNVPVPRNEPPGRNLTALTGTSPAQIARILFDPQFRLGAFLRETLTQWRWRRDVSGDRDPNEDLAEAILRRLQADAVRDGSRLIYVVCPHRHWIREGQDGFHRRLVGFLGGAGIESIDLTAAFAARETDSPETSLFSDLIGGRIVSHAAHWSARGYRLAADVAADHLQRVFSGAQHPR